MSKVFLFDAARCNGCHCCQVSCKDEFCGVDWAPYSKAQLETGQFWCKVNQETRGSVPKVKVAYRVEIGAQDDAIKGYAPEVLEDREDGLVVIDPEKASGRKDLADRFEGVYWNDELGIPQGCTGCAHLLDDGWDVPRCVDACATGALRFGDEADFADELAHAERLSEGSHVYYLNLPKRFVAGEVCDEEADEVIIGAAVTAVSETGESYEARTDDFGDFWIEGLPKGKFEVRFEADGYLLRTLDADATDRDANMGSIALYKG